MKNKLAVFATLISIHFLANAQLVVSDPVAELNLIISYAAQLTQYAQQVEQYKLQMQQYQALVGSRGMGAIRNDQSLRQPVPATLFNDVTTIPGAQAAASQASSQLISTQNRVSMLQSLSGAIDSTTDAKASADLTNRIQVENAYLANEKAMAQAGKDNQDALAAQQAIANKAGSLKKLMGTSVPDLK